MSSYVKHQRSMGLSCSFRLDLEFEWTLHGKQWTETKIKDFMILIGVFVKKEKGFTVTFTYGI